MVGVAAGAVGAASVAATRFFIAGAEAGARRAWQGARATLPGITAQAPRPESLPAPIPSEPPVASECARRVQGRGGVQQGEAEEHPRASEHRQHFSEGEGVASKAPGRRPGEVVERGSGRATYARAATRVIAPS